MLDNDGEMGRLLAPVVGHLKRKTAVRQAQMWNDVLESAEVSSGEPSRYVVEVQKKEPDGLWYLVWRERT
jgi:hypothetical protein